jgi:hypothetical protein
MGMPHLSIPEYRKRERRILRFSHFLLTVFCLASLLLAFQGTAQAYADPGSGLLALQIIGSTLAGIGFYFRQKIGKLFIHFRHTAEAAPIEAGNPDNPSQPKPE